MDETMLPLESNQHDKPRSRPYSDPLLRNFVELMMKSFYRKSYGKDDELESTVKLIVCPSKVAAHIYYSTNTKNSNREQKCMWFLRLGLNHGFVKGGKENDCHPSLHISMIQTWPSNKEKGVPANFWEESFIAADPVLQNQIKGFEKLAYTWNVI